MHQISVIIVKCHTLQTAFVAHGCFKHAFLHFSLEHCSELSQSESLTQFELTDPLTKNKTLKSATKINSICAIIFKLSQRNDEIIPSRSSLLSIFN